MSGTPFGVLFLITGSICLLGSVYWFVYSVHQVTTSQWASGRVTNIITRHWRRSRDSYYPVFVFTDQKGVQHTVQSATSTRTVSQHVGDVVTLLYTPGDEQHACIYSVMGVWVGPVILLFIGIVHASLGSVVLGLTWPLDLILFLMTRRSLGRF